MKHIAIYGSYDFGNFGDDLMAVMISVYLKNKGYRPLSYGLDSKISEKYGIERTNSIQCLLENASLLIIGGGSTLAPIPTGLISKFEKEFEEINLFTKRKNIPIYCVSVGGDGSSTDTQLSFHHWDLLKNENIKEISYRLPDDESLLNLLNQKAFFYPDIVLNANEIWPVAKNRKEKVRIGININQSCYNKYFLFLLKTILIFKSKYEIIFIKSHLEEYNINYEYIPNKLDGKLKKYQYFDVKEMCEFISNLDLLISSKLHLGITALSYGVPFCSFGGLGKTKAFLKSINASEAYIIGRKLNLLKLAYKITSKDYLRKFKLIYKNSDVNEHIKKSSKHFEFLQKSIEENYS